LDEKNNDSSLYYAKKQMHLAQSIGSQNLEAAYTNLFKSYELNGYKDSAYVYQGLALEAYEKISKERIKNLNNFQKEAFKEQERLQQLEEEKIDSKNKLRSYTLLTVLSVFLIIGFFLYRNNRQKQKANKILQEQKEKVERTLRELKSTQSQLIQSEKMASLGELTAGIAHEIQNPLNFVNNFSEVTNELVDEMKIELATGNQQLVTEIADDIKDNLIKINHHGQRAADIVKGMLQHSRSSSGTKEPTDINALADEYLRLAYHGLRAKDKSFNATMKTEFDESIGSINVVPQDIGRVVLNLITNAFYVVNEKAKQGIAGYEPTVSITTKRSPLHGRGAGGEAVFITFKDNGNGIPQKILDKIFQPFFTTKPTGQGTGLGLSLSYDIVKAHGGELKVETEEGEGSEFSIELPNS
jgi:signal transduction histidine kinase